MNRVPFVDLQAQIRPLQPQLLAATERVLQSSQYCLGPEVEAFEAEFGAMHETLYAVGVSSGTAALHLALQAAGVGPGDEVVTSPLTFVATAAAIRYVGARPVYADVEEHTGTLCPSAVEAALSPRTRALLPVHLHGQPGRLSELREVARKHNLLLIEDACQAHLARHHGQPVGTFGLAAAFSFYPAKNLGACGEAGLLVTNEPDVAEQARELRDWGQSRKYQHDRFGHNYRMDALQAAFLRVKLPHLSAWTSARQRLAQRYDELLSELPLTLPGRTPENEPVFHLYAVRVENRDEVKEQLHARGVDCGIHYPVPVHMQPAYRDPAFPPGSFPVAEGIARTTLSLPLFPELTEGQQDRVAAALREVLA